MTVLSQLWMMKSDTDECRFVTIGTGLTGRVLVVVFCFEITTFA
jgi:hypothetical protein